MQARFYLFLGILIVSTSFINVLAQAGNGDKRVLLSAEEHKVTVKEYCNFLNAVAASDTHGFYEEWMGSDPDAICILRSGTPDNYSYSVVEGKGSMSIAQVNLLNQARYCNWLENGQPIVFPDFQNRESTEDGVYTLNGEKIVAVNSEANHLLRDGLKDDSEKSLNVDPQLMMDPAAIEETGKALQRGLGFSEKNASSTQVTPGFSSSRTAQSSQFTDNFTDFTNPNVFTIVQNHTSASNTFSSSSQHIDPALKDQTQQAIGKIISNSSTQLYDYYKKADDAWVERDSGWKEHSRLGNEFQESCKQLTLSKKKLDQASQATSSEELEQTRLGKIAKYAGIAGDALGHVLEPHAQVASVGVSKLAGFADTINTTWAKVNLALAKIEYQQVSQQNEQAQERKNQAYQKLLPLEQRAEEIETLASAQAEQTIKKLAEQLHPQIDWRESQWQAWGNLLGQSAWNQQEIQGAINLARRNPSWIEEATKKVWQQKLETGKEKYHALHAKANLASLKRQYEEDRQQLQRAQTQEKQQQRHLNEGQQGIEELKHEIEKRVDELERLETKDKVQFERKKKEFIEKLQELEKTQLRLQGLQKKWEDAVQRTSKQNEHLWLSSEVYANAEKEARRTLARIKKAYQSDRELFQKIWNQGATSNYKEWSLPKITTSHETENILDPFDASRGEEAAPPVQKLEEIEMRGRNLHLREAMMNSSTTGKPTVLTAMLHPFSKQPSLTKQTSSLYAVPSSLDQVREWSLQKQPSAQDQERWEVREKLDQVQKEIIAQRKELQKGDAFIEGKIRNNNEMDDEDDDDGKTQLSTASEQSSSSKASSTLSVSKHSVLSFGGGSLFGGNKKQPISSLPSISEETAQDPQEKLRQLQQQASELKRRYFELLDQAESERLSSLKGQRAAIPFTEETDRNYAWEEADRKSVALIQAKRREQEREKIAQEEQESWQTNTERWRLRAQTDLALGVFKQAQQRTLKLGEEVDKAKTKAQLTEANRKRDASLAEEKRLQEAYFAAEETWEKIAQEYRSDHSEQTIAQEKTKEEIQEQAYERLKERDRAVNQRWEKLLQNYQNSEFEKSGVEQEEIGEAIMVLKDQLEEAYQSSFIKYKDQEALAHYREVAFKRALDHARNHPEEMAEAWKQIGVLEKNIPEPQKKINKEAEAVFNTEVKRLERIEKIWEGILEDEQKEATQKQEQAVQEYYRGNPADWYALGEQEQTYYNNEAIKANKKYDQKREEAEECLADAKAEQLRVEAEIKRIEGKSWLSISSTKRKEKTDHFQQQLITLEDTIKKTSNQLAEQKNFLRIGKKAKEKENYYEALTQAQNNEEKAKDIKNSYWKKAAECYRKVSTNWEKAADDNILEQDQKKNEKIAIFYQSAAESYGKAAQENDLLLKNKGKEALVQLYNEEAKGYQQLALQQEKGESTSGSLDTSATFDIQENLYQLKKKIERHLGTRGAKIEELQESLPSLQKRLEELDKEIAILRQQGKEALALKKEGLSASLRELIVSCQKALEDLLQEIPGNSERAATAIESIQSHKIKDQQLQQSIEQTLQLEAKIVPLEQRAARLSLETKAAQTRGELFLSKGQQELTAQLNQALEQARKMKEQLLTQSEGTANIATQFQTCMSGLQQVEVQDRYLQQIISQLQQLDQNKIAFNARGGELKNSIQAARSQGETLLAQGQERLYNEAKKLFLEIEPIAEQLLARTENTSERINDYLRRFSQFQTQDQVFQKNIPCLRELGQYKNSFQKRVEVLSGEITASQSKNEVLLVEGQQQLNKTIGQALTAIERAANQILVGANNSTEEATVLLGKLKQLEARDESLQKNMPTLQVLEQKRNAFQNRLKNLTTEISTSQNQGKTYLNEGQQTLANEITQFLFKIDENAKQLLTIVSEAPAATSKALLAQLEQLLQRDQQLQQNAPDLEKLSEKKNFFQERVETLNKELQSSQDHQQFILIQKQLLLELNQSIIKIDQHAKQFLSGTTGAEQFQDFLNQLSVLEQRDQRLQKHLTQLKNLEQLFSPLKNREKALENEIIISQNRGEITLSQEQQTLLDEMKKTLQQTSEAAKQLLIEDQGPSEETGKASEVTFQRVQELIPLLGQLRLRDERLQEKILFLRDLEQKKKLLQERLQSFKVEIDSSEKAGEPLLAQQQQALTKAFHCAFDKSSEASIQLMTGTAQSLEQAKTLFQEVDQLQQRDRQLQENIVNVQKLQQKKNSIQQRLAELWSAEMTSSQSQEEIVITEGQQALVNEMRGILLPIEVITAQLRNGVLGISYTSEQAKDLLFQINQFEQRDQALQAKANHIAEEIAKFRIEAREKTAKLTIQIEEAKQASKEKHGGENSYLWDRITTKLEQARDSWDRFNELVGQGKRKQSVLWRKVAEESEASAEGMRRAVISYSSGNQEVAKRLDKEAWNAYYLSDANTWSLKSEEALEKANQVFSKDRNFWRNLAEQYKVAADYERKASEAHLADKEDESNNCTWIGRYTHSSADRKLKAMEARLAGKEVLAAGYQDAAETLQKAAEQRTQALTAYIAGKQSEGNSWYWESESLQSQANYQVKACEAQDAGKTALATGYQEAAATSQKAADQHKIAAQTKATGKESEGNSWYWVGNSLQTKADYQAKACEAQDAGQTILATGYREAAATSQRAADQWKLSAQRKAAEQQNVGVSWGNEGTSLQKKADYQAKAAEAQEAGKTTLAAGYREAVVTSQQAADQRKLSAETYAVGKESEAGSWSWEGSSLQAKADYQAKASEAQGAGKTRLAKGYKEVTLMFQQAADQRKLAAQAYAAEKKDEGEIWDSAGKAFQAQADYYKKAIEVREAGKEALAAGYEEVAAISQRAANYGRLAAEKQKESALAHASVNHAYCEGKLLQSQADYQAKAIEAGEAGKEELARGYKEAAMTVGRAADCFSQAALAFIQKKNEEVMDNWIKAGNSLTLKATYQHKKIEAENTEKTLLETDYEEVIEILKKATEYHQRAAEAHGQIKRKYIDLNSSREENSRNYWMKIDEADFYAEIGKNFYCAAEKLGKMIDAKIENKLEEAKKWYEVVEQYKHSAAYYEKEVEKILANEVIRKYKHSNNVGKDFCNVAEKLEQAIESEIEGKGEIAQKLREIAEQYKHAAKYHTQSLKAYEQGKDAQAGAIYLMLAEAFNYIASYSEEAICEDALDKQEIAKKWREVVERHMHITKCYIQAVEAHEQGKKDEGSYWFQIGCSLLENNDAVVGYLKKAIEEEALGKLEIAKKWNELIEQQVCSAEYYIKAVEAHEQGKKDESINWENAGKYIYLAAGKLEKALEKGRGIADQWREAAEQCNRCAEQFVQAAIAYNQGQTSEGERYHNAGVALSKVKIN